MSIFAEAVFERGVLRPKHPLDLAEGQAVHLTIVPRLSPADEANRLRLVREASGIVPWTGDVAELRRIAEDDVFDPVEGWTPTAPSEG